MPNQVPNNYYRIHLEEKHQDLIYIDVQVGDFGIGTIIAINKMCSPMVANVYADKAFNLKDNPVGKTFNYADPFDGFNVKTNSWAVDSIEELGKTYDWERDDVLLVPNKRVAIIKD